MNTNDFIQADTKFTSLSKHLGTVYEATSSAPPDAATMISTASSEIPETKIEKAKTSTGTYAILPKARIPTSTFHNLKNNIFYNILIKSVSTIPKFIFKVPVAGAKPELPSKDKEELSYGFTLNSFLFNTVYVRYFRKLEDSSKLPPIVPSIDYHVWNIVNGNRNLLSLNQYRARMHADLSIEKALTEPIYNAINHILSYVHNGYFKLRFRNVLDFHKNNVLVDNFTDTLVYQSLLHDCTQIKLPPREFDFPAGKPINEVNDIVQIPFDMQNKLLKITKYFAEVKDKLVLDKESGYYCYVVHDVPIPVICTHDYMALNGDPPELISRLCWKDGKCKYCDQEISAYHDLYKEEMPPIIYSIILKFVETIIDDIDIDGLYLAFFDLVYDMVSHLRKRGIEANDKMIIALVTLYLYKIYLASKSTITFNTAKFLKFTDAMNRYCVDAGWSPKVIDTIINDDKYIGNVSNVPQMIKSFSYITEIKYVDTLPMSIMFEKAINPLSDYKLTPVTNLQKLYCSGQEKMSQFNEAVSKALMKLWECRHASDCVNRIKDIVISEKFENIRTTVVKNGQQFFYTICKSFCPATENNTHKWTSDTCSKCGLKKDLSNKESIYDKYQIVINNTTTMKPSLRIIGLTHDEVVDDFSAISKYDPKRTFIEFVIPPDHSYIEFFMTNLQNQKHQEKVVDYIRFMVPFDLKESEMNIDNILRCLSYIVDRKLDTSSRVVSELLYVFIRVKDKRMLINLRGPIKRDVDTVESETTNEA